MLLRILLVCYGVVSIDRRVHLFPFICVKYFIKELFVVFLEIESISLVCYSLKSIVIGNIVNL